MMSDSMYQLFASYYDQIFDFNQDLFLPIFNRPYQHALDIGCGTGRLTHLIHVQKIKVIGIDLDSEMIKIAQHKYPNLQFEIQNMLHLEDFESFDLITCFGNTIPHINPNEFHQFFLMMEEKLLDDGILWIQLLNYDHLLKHKIKALKPIIKDGFKFYRTYEFFDKEIKFHTKLETKDATHEGVTTLYPYQMHDFLDLEKTHHLKVNVYGSLNETPYDMDRDYYLYVKVKKALI
jgi:SAM-dependent methyltransferase